MKPKKKITYALVSHGAYHDAHEPLHKVVDGCDGCDAYRLRRNRNGRAGRTLGVNPREDDASGACQTCKVPVWRGLSAHVNVWMWNHDVDRAQWALEDATGSAPPTHCPRCRRKAA